MKVLFVMPKMEAWATHGKHCAPNQFYAQLIAYVREKKLADCYAIDARVEDLDFKLMMDKIKEINPDVIFLGEILHSTGGFAPIWHYIKLTQEVKKVLPSTKIVVGGLWFSALFEDTLKRYPAIDFVVIGEAEITFFELLQSLKEGAADFSSIAGLASRNEARVVVGPHRELIKNLDVLPIPAYDLFPMQKYVGHTHWKPFCELLVSRGCPGGCVFCYEWSQYDPRSPRDFVSWRIKSAEKILDELEVLNKKYGVNVIVFQDDAFNVSKETVEKVCRGMIHREIKMNWVILGRADDWVNQLDLIPLMKEAGMFMGLLGVEVGSDEELKKIGKGVDTHQIVQTIEALRKENIMSIGCFMVGFEDDTEAIVKQRFEFADQSDPDIFALQFFTPVPGSPIWKKYIDKGWVDLNNLDLRDWDFQHPVVPTNHLSIEDVGRLGSWCMREFFSKTERVARLFQGSYHDLAVKCVRDFMENISSFESGATKKKNTQVEIKWDDVVEKKFRTAISKMPFFHRRIAEKMVKAKSESIARQKNDGQVSEQELVSAFFEETPSAFKGLMKGVLADADIDYKKYKKD
ncbi:MAG: radical SAM protein [Candidatus Omnitrophota bacterium]|nr:B12-binding domain-containing radical SAM protein [Candidatus Omnitrophota bacterium]